MTHATLTDAPAVLNTNDKAMWVLGHNAARETTRTLTSDEVWAVWHVAGHPGPTAFAAAIQRRFCEVNGLTLATPSQSLRIAGAAGPLGDEGAAEVECPECKGSGLLDTSGFGDLDTCDECHGNGTVGVGIPDGGQRDA